MSARTLLGISIAVTLTALVATPAGASVALQPLGFCGGDDWEPAVAAAPGGYVYVLITHYSGATNCVGANGDDNARIMIQVSNDGGSTFSAPQVVSNTPDGIAYPLQADPAIAVDPSTGAVYVAFLAYGLSGGHTDVYVARSNDHGKTFSQVTKVNSKNFQGITGCKNCDHEKILATGGDVYVAYGQAQYHFVSVSSNGGVSFSQYTVDSTFVVTFAEAAALDAKGDAWFAWGDCETSNCTGNPAFDYRVSETLAGTSKTTFSPVIATSPQGPDCPFSSCGFAYFGAQDGFAIDGGGTLYLDWQTAQAKKSPPIINLSSCSSRCLTTPSAPADFSSIPTGCSTGCRGWQVVSRVDDDPAPSSYALFPNLVGGSKAGQISATWMDDRNGNASPCSGFTHTCGWNLWYRASGTGGATWIAPGQQISTFDPAQSQETPVGFLFPYGDYTGIVNSQTCAGGSAITWGAGHDWVGGPSAPGHIEFASLC